MALRLRKPRDHVWRIWSGAWSRMLAWALISISAVPSGRTAVARQAVDVISGNELREAGVARISEALLLIPGLRVTTLDGYHYRFAIDGRAPIFGSGPAIYADGHPLLYPMFGMNQISLLPLSVAEFDSIHVSRIADQAAFAWPDAGRIDVRTIRPPGLALNATFFVRNESGDPGPYRYTEERSPNVDRSGPRIEAVASYGNEHWFVRASARVDEHHLTDERITPRVTSLYTGYEAARINLASGDVFVERTNESGRHSIHVVRTVVSDLAYLVPAGFEIPLEQAWWHASAAGRERLGGGASVSYLLDRRWLSIGERPTRAMFGPGLSFAYTLGSASLRIPAGAAVLEFETGISTVENDATLGEPSANRIGFRFGARVADGPTRHLISVRLTDTLGSHGRNGPLGVGIQWSVGWRSESDVVVELSTALQRSLRPSPISPEALVARGDPVPLVDLPGLNEHFPASVEFEFRAGLSTPLVSDLRLTVSAFLRRYRDLTVLVAPRASIPQFSNTGSGPSVIRAPALDNLQTDVASGSLAGYDLGIAWESEGGNRASWHQSYLARVTGGDDGLSRFMQGIAGHRFTMFATWAVSDRFRVHAHGEWAPRRTWPPLPGEDRETRMSRLSADITFQKDLWGEHLQASLGIRNLGRSGVRYHPDGVVDALALQVMLIFRLRD